MKKNNDVVRFCGAMLALIAIVFIGVHEKETAQVFASLKNSFNNAASVFFVDSTTETDLLARYSAARTGTHPIKIIIVAGHDDTAYGALYRGRREADMTVKLAEQLSQFFSGDSEFKTILTRTSSGYNPLFWDYREKEKENILAFVQTKKQDMAKLVERGSVHERDGVEHNTAPGQVVMTLYSVNKWANELAADVVLHIHFNDAAERRRDAPYEYSGFSIYIPESQYSNAKASRAVAKPIFDRLSKFHPVSNLPKEDAGLVESQDLIAVGAYNTLDSVGMLIEYGYIYEPQFENAEVRDKTIAELAWQTYLGLHDFFKTEKSKTLPEVGFLGTLNKQIEKGSRDKGSILDVQKALLLADMYPPKGKDSRDCPLSGNFGECTEMALEAFQIKENISGEKGKAGERTLDALAKRLFQ